MPLIPVTPLFPYTTLFRSGDRAAEFEARMAGQAYRAGGIGITTEATRSATDERLRTLVRERIAEAARGGRSEEHTSELQSRGHLVCRLLLEKKNATQTGNSY